MKAVNWMRKKFSPKGRRIKTGIDDDQINRRSKRIKDPAWHQGKSSRIQDLVERNAAYIEKNTSNIDKNKNKIQDVDDNIRHAANINDIRGYLNRRGSNSGIGREWFSAPPLPPPKKKSSPTLSGQIEQTRRPEGRRNLGYEKDMQEMKKQRAERRKEWGPDIVGEASAETGQFISDDDTSGLSASAQHPATRILQHSRMGPRRLDTGGLSAPLLAGGRRRRRRSSRRRRRSSTRRRRSSTRRRRSYRKRRSSTRRRRSYRKRRSSTRRRR